MDEKRRIEYSFRSTGLFTTDPMIEHCFRKSHLKLKKGKNEIPPGLEVANLCQIYVSTNKRTCYFCKNLLFKGFYWLIMIPSHLFQYYIGNWKVMYSFINSLIVEKSMTLFIPVEQRFMFLLVEPSSYLFQTKGSFYSC